MSLKFILGYILYFMLLAWVIMKLWNGLVPNLTGWSGLNYNDSLVLLVLVRLLVGFKFLGKGYLKQKFGHKWSNLSDNEREEMREKFKSRWCNKD
ncbi:MAG: hypothetical protein L3J29_03945 [Cyclobacteriaceae bacterium]|nr:hypothetical protein [Cyclobacteriaceae bacterium]